jgi:hypothetical protein
MQHFASFIGGFFLRSIAALALTSFAVNILRLSHRENLANKITEKVSGYMWLLALGGGAHGDNRRRG